MLGTGAVVVTGGAALAAAAVAYAGLSAGALTTGALVGSVAVASGAVTVSSLIPFAQITTMYTKKLLKTYLFKRAFYS